MIPTWLFFLFVVFMVAMMLFTPISRARNLIRLRRLRKGIFAALILLAIAPAAHAEGMTHADWINLAAPTVAAIVLASGGLVVALLTGLTGKVNAYFVAHDQLAAARVLTAANAAIDKEVETSASVIAGKIDRGELDYTKRADWQREAVAEAALVQDRLPALAKAAVAAGTPILTQIMARVDDKAVASPTINVPVAVAA